ADERSVLRVGDAVGAERRSPQAHRACEPQAGHVRAIGVEWLVASEDEQPAAGARGRPPDPQRGHAVVERIRNVPPEMVAVGVDEEAVDGAGVAPDRGAKSELDVETGG